MIRKFSITSLCLFILVLSGCLQSALQLSPGLVPNFAASIFEECDSELAKNAIPANLKLMEGLLKNDPKNKQILTTLSMGFAGYSMLFVEAQDPERGSDLYLRARGYGIMALGAKGAGLKDTGVTKEGIQAVLKTLGKEDLEALIWTTVSWNAWINLNLDKPAALAQLNIPQACLEKVMEIDAEYLHGLPYILMGVSLAARPQMFGGDIKQSQYYFDKGLELSHGKFFLAQYYFARYYAVRAQNKKLFLKLIQEIKGADPRGLKDVCLINVVMQQKAEELGKMADELFF
jgi:hypothetical protein